MKRKSIRDEKAIKSFGKRVKELRMKYDLSQEQLAFEAGVSAKQISRVEKGEINTGISTILAIARVLDVHVKELFNF